MMRAEEADKGASAGLGEAKAGVQSGEFATGVALEAMEVDGDPEDGCALLAAASHCFATLRRAPSMAALLMFIALPLAFAKDTVVGIVSGRGVGERSMESS